YPLAAPAFPTPTLFRSSRTMFQLINRIDPAQFNYFFIYGGGPAQFRNFRSYKVPSFSIPVNDDYCLAILQLIKKTLELSLDEFRSEEHTSALQSREKIV